MKTRYTASLLASMSFTALAQNSDLQTAEASAEPLHIVLIDACYIPATFDFLKGKKIEVDLITSAKPVLKHLFTPAICTDFYKKAVGPEGELVGFHSHFLGSKLHTPANVEPVLDKIQAQRGKVDLVLANSSDLATYISHHVRDHLGLPEVKWTISTPEVFYDKWEMKTALTQNDPGIHTAPFISFDAAADDIAAFATQTGFPLILKKKRSAGSVDIKVLNDMAALRKVSKKITDKDNYLVEKFITGMTFRFNGEIEDGELKVMIPSFNRTSPLEHYQGGKTRVTTSIDENEIAHERINDFTLRTLKALGMHSGTYHLEGIYSDADHELYFMEIAARPGEGNMDDAFRAVHSYNPKRSFYYRQFPAGFFGEPTETALNEEMLTTNHVGDAPGEVYSVLTYPFLDANHYTFQHVTTNLSLDLEHGHAAYPTLRGCSYDDTLRPLLASGKALHGSGVSRYAFQACLKAVSCYFTGERTEVEADLQRFETQYFFKAEPRLSGLNMLVPRKHLMAGGL